MYQILEQIQTDVYTTGDTYTKVRVRLVCDALSDLPGIHDISGLELQMGSTAKIITTAQNMMMQSNGTWSEQTSSSIASLVNDISMLQSDVSALENRIGEAENRITQLQAAAAGLIDRGAKNLLQMTHASGSLTRYGVTCTWDTDAGTMTLNGSHVSTDSTAIFEFYSGNASDQRQVPAGDYVLTGCPSGGSTSTYRATLTGITGGIDTGNGAEFTLASQTYLAYRILVSGNVSFTDKVFKPMVTYQDYYKISPVFVPYAPTNAELYALIRSYHP